MNGKANRARQRYLSLHQYRRALDRINAMDPLIFDALMLDLAYVPVPQTMQFCNYLLRAGPPAFDHARAGRWAFVMLLADPTLWYGVETGDVRETMRELAAMRRGEFLRRIGYPGNGLAVNAMSKLRFGSCTSRSLVVLQQCLATPACHAHMAHLRSLNWGVMSLILHHAPHHIPAKLLRQVERSMTDDTSGPRSIYSQIALLTSNHRRLGKTLLRLPADSDSLERQLIECGVHSGECFFAQPPEGLAGRIEQLTTKDEFEAEGEHMRHCVAQLWKMAAMGMTAIYRVLPCVEERVQRATVCIDLSERATLRDVRGVENVAVSPETEQFVRCWLNRTVATSASHSTTRPVRVQYT